MEKVFIFCEGGLVQAVSATDDMEVIVVDHDVADSECDDERGNYEEGMKKYRETINNLKHVW